VILPVTEPSHAVFLSYASQDAEAAQRICEALHAAGIEVWFDQSELRGGDAWDRQIRKQIHECALFMPVISVHSDARREGYFRREWKLAVDRTADMADDVAFLLPVVIDNTPDATARVPDRFHEVQWSRLPDGIPTPEFVALAQALLTNQVVALAPPSVRALTSADVAIPEPGGVRRAPRDRALKRPFRHATVFGLAAIVIIGAGYFALDRLVLSKRSLQPPIVPVEKSIAVLPFVDMSEKHDQEYFGDGIAEEIVDLLAKIPGLKVIGRTSSFQFRGNTSDLRKIGASLGVVYLVEGSVRKSGDQLKVAVQLIDARDGTHRWSDTYERDSVNALSLQRQIAVAVARELQVSVTDYFGTGGTTKSAEAYDLYLRGIRDVDKNSDQDTALRAIAELSKAVEIDPAYVNAWVGLADAYDSAATANSSPRAESYRLARLAVDKALALDPNDADAYAMRAFIRMNVWDWTGAEEDIHRSLKVRKTSSAAQAGAKLAIARGNLLEAEALLRGVLATDPLDAYSLGALAFAVYPRLGRFEDSDRLISKLRDINANAEGLNAAQSLNAVFEGRYDLALRLAESETDVEQREMALAIVYTAMGKSVESKQTLERLLQNPTTLEFDVASVYAYRGERDLALQHLELAYAQHSVDLLNLKTDPLLSGIRTEPKYRQLLRQMNLPE
jgi:TolB-like protein/Flp pilus assembly protein TadD